jgi:hypothetical protein
MWIRMSLVAVLLAGALTGCITKHTCVSWVDFETPQDAYDDARLVVRGAAGEVVGVRDLYGVAAPVHRVEVLEVLGGSDPGATIDVASTPLTCMGDAGEYPDGDPLDVEGELILFLTRAEGGGWRLMTPYDGVLPMPDDGVLPFEVADR